MKQLLLFTTLFTAALHTWAQKGSAELMSGHRYLHYLHTLGQPVAAQSKFGWQHIATLIKRYQPVKEKQGGADELMNQAYLTYGFTRWLSIKGGLFYNNAGGYKPSVAVQFLLAHKNGTVVFSPRADVSSKQAYEMFVFSEYFIPASGTTRFMVRVQAMSNASTAHHNRSYQFIRLGVDINNLQFGGGLTLDEYGTSNTVLYNAGVFIRKKW